MHKGAPGPRGPRPEWKEAKRFVDGSYAVVVDILPSAPPSFSVRCGRVRPDGSFTPNVTLRREGTFQITLVDRPSSVLPALLEKAEAWILEEMALRFNDDIDRKIERETKQANFGKPDVRVTGKTERKKARRAGTPPV